MNLAEINFSALFYSEEGYGTDPSVTRSVTQKRIVSDAVNPDGTIAAPFEAAVTTVYDFYGNIVKQSGYGVETVEYEYDNADRVTKERYADGTVKTYF